MLSSDELCASANNISNTRWQLIFKRRRGCCNLVSNFNTNQMVLERNCWASVFDGKKRVFFQIMKTSLGHSILYISSHI